MRKPVYIPIELSFNNPYECNLNIKKGDTLDVTFKIFDKSILKDLTGQTITLVLRKSNGGIVEKVITSSSVGTASVYLDDISTNCVGLVGGELTISDVNGQATTNTFTFNVRDAYATDIVNLSKDDITTLNQLQQAVKTGEEIMQRYEEAIVAIAGSGEQIAQLNSIRLEIASNRKNIIEENAEAVINIANLHAGNTLAEQNTAALDVQNDRTEVLLPQITTANNTADVNIADLDTKNQFAVDNIALTQSKIDEMHIIEATVITENVTASQNITLLDTKNATAVTNEGLLDSKNAEAVVNEGLLDTKNGTASQNISALDSKNAIAAQHEIDLDTKNALASTNEGLLDSKNAIAAQHEIDLDAKNALAAQNETDLDAKNLLASQNEALLDTKNQTAVDNQAILDTKTQDAIDATVDMVTKTDDAKATTTTLDALNVDSKATEQRLNDANTDAQQYIADIQGYNTSTIPADVDALKAEIVKARRTFADLDERVTEGEGSGGFYIGATLPALGDRKSGILYMKTL